MLPALENARAAVTQLQAFLVAPVVTDRDRAGVIQAFEFSFEAVWKLFKHLAESEGLAAPSPKSALTAAYQLGLAVDEAVWLDMLRARNLTSHTYHAALAVSIFEAVRDSFAAALVDGVARAATRLASP